MCRLSSTRSHCRYVRETDGTLLCVECGDTTTRSFPADSPTSWPHKICGKPQKREKGCGHHAAMLIAELGMKKEGCGACNDMVVDMNIWGPEGCRQNREKIIERLRVAYSQSSWTDCIKAAANATRTGAAFKVNPLHPVESLLAWLVDESIRRAEASASLPDGS